MCRTPYCFGDCEECIAEDKYQKELEESITDCPYRKECNWVTVSIKSDKCTTCGQVYTYP